MFETYPGGKGGAGVFQTIINMIPPHDIFISSHLGNCAIMRNKLPAARNIGIDLSPMVISTWKKAITARIDGNGAHRCTPETAILQHHQNCGCVPESIAKNGNGGPESAIQPHAPSAVQTRQTPVESARLLSRKSACLTPIVNNDAAGSPDIELVESDAVTWLAEFFADQHGKNGGMVREKVFIYHDPPYVIETRSTQRELYEKEYTYEDHERLLDFIVTLPCNQAISGYYSPLYMERLATWNHITFQAMTRGGTMATEYLWFNYDEPQELHDYRYLGENYRQRERIKRKRKRWVNRLKKMDSLERWAILSAIEEVFNTDDFKKE